MFYQKSPDAKLIISDNLFLQFNNPLAIITIFVTSTEKNDDYLLARNSARYLAC